MTRRRSRRHSGRGGVPRREHVALVAARRISRLGVALDVHSLVYNPLVFYGFHRLARVDADAVITAFTTVFPSARKYIDVGAGTGTFAAEGRRQGLEITACEHARIGRWIARVQGVGAAPFDLEREPPAPVGKGFDVAYCFEVAEHLDALHGARLVEFLAALAPVVVFTAAPPGQGGTGHINEQPPEYWIKRYGAAGMAYNAPLTHQLRGAYESHGVEAAWLRTNTMVFTTAPRYD